MKPTGKAAGTQAPRLAKGLRIRRWQIGIGRTAPSHLRSWSQKIQSLTRRELPAWLATSLPGMKRRIPDILALAAGIAAYALATFSERALAAFFESTLANVFQRALVPALTGAVTKTDPALGFELWGIFSFAALEEATKALFCLPFLISGWRAPPVGRHLPLERRGLVHKDTGKAQSPHLSRLFVPRNTGQASNPRCEAEPVGRAGLESLSGADGTPSDARTRRNKRFLGMQRGMVVALAFALAETVAYTKAFPQSGILARFGWSIPLHLASTSLALCAMDLFLRRLGGLRQSTSQTALPRAERRTDFLRSGRTGILPTLGLALASWSLHAAGNTIVIALPGPAASFWGSIGMLLCSLTLILGIYLPRLLGGLYDDP